MRDDKTKIDQLHAFGYPTSDEINVQLNVNQATACKSGVLRHS